MSRSGYTYDAENGALWRGMVASASRGKRGQKFLRELLAALDAMPEKSLIADFLERDGEVCAIGALAKAKGLDFSEVDADEPEEVGRIFDIAPCLAQEVAYMNDEFWEDQALTPVTPEQRWEKMRGWVVGQLNAKRS